MLNKMLTKGVLAKSALSCLVVVGATGVTAKLLPGNTAHAANPDHVRQLLRTGDCPGCDLSSISLNGLTLTEADLQGADFSNTRLSNIQLVRANLSSANLSGAIFRLTDLTGANLQNANLSDASSFFICSQGFYGTDDDSESSCITQMLWFRLAPELCAEDSELSDMLIGALNDIPESFCEESGAEYFTYSLAYSQVVRPGLIARGADLSGANLQGATFAGADFDYAVLTDTDAEDAQFDYATLFYADISSLKSADLAEAWESPQALVDWLAVVQTEAEEKRRQDYGRSYLGSLSQAQIIYHNENEAFTSEIADITGDDVSEESLFDFGIVEELSTDNKVIQYALNRAGDLPSVISVVWSYPNPNAEGESYADYALCISDTAKVFTVSDLPDIEVSENTSICPEGWTSAY